MYAGGTAQHHARLVGALACPDAPACAAKDWQNHQVADTTFRMQDHLIFRGGRLSAAHLGLGDGFMHLVRAANLLQHAQHGLVRPSMGRSP